MSAVGESANSNVVEIPGGMLAGSQASQSSGHDSEPPGDGAGHQSSHGTGGSGTSHGSAGESSHKEGGDPSQDTSHQGHHRHSGSESRTRGGVELRQKRSAAERLEQKSRRSSGESQYYVTVEGPNDEQDSLGVYRTEQSTLASSPRIQEGLIKRLDQVKEKGKLGELKFAAKIHKRKPSPESPTPMRAMAKDERDGVSPYNSSRQPVDVTEEEVALAVEKSYFKRQNSLKYRKKRSSPPTVEGGDTSSGVRSRGIPVRRRTDSGSENEDSLVNSQSRNSSHKEPEVLVRQESLRRRHRTPSSGSGSDIGDGDGTSSRHSHKSSSDSHHGRHHGKPPGKDPEQPLARYSRGRSSARERVASKEYTTEKRSSSVGAVEGREAVPKGAVVKDKPPLAKGAKEGANVGHKEKQKSPLSRGGSKEESGRGRIRTKSESQASSEDDDSSSQRAGQHGDSHAPRGRHTSGGGSSSSEHEGRSEKPDAKAQAQKKPMFKHHKRSVGFSPNFFVHVNIFEASCKTEVSAVH